MPDRIFCPFASTPPYNLKNQNFEKMKKIPEDIIILHMSTINDNHMTSFMIPKIWSTTNRIFCHFGQCFALLPPNNPENQNFKKMKKKTPGDIIILHMCTINDNHMMYGS